MLSKTLKSCIGRFESNTLGYLVIYSPEISLMASHLRLVKLRIVDGLVKMVQMVEGHLLPVRLRITRGIRKRGWQRMTVGHSWEEGCYVEVVYWQSLVKGLIWRLSLRGIVATTPDCEARFKSKQLKLSLGNTSLIACKISFRNQA